MMSRIVKQCESEGTEAEQIASSAVVEAPSRTEIVNTLRGEAKYRPTMWGDARPLLICAADEIERQAARNAELESEKEEMRHVFEAGVAYVKKAAYSTCCALEFDVLKRTVEALAQPQQPEGGA